MRERVFPEGGGSKQRTCQWLFCGEGGGGILSRGVKGGFHVMNDFFPYFSALFCCIFTFIKSLTLSVFFSLSLSICPFVVFAPSWNFLAFIGKKFFLHSLIVSLFLIDYSSLSIYIFFLTSFTVSVFLSSSLSRSLCLALFVLSISLSLLRPRFPCFVKLFELDRITFRPVAILSHIKRSSFRLDETDAYNISLS